MEKRIVFEKRSSKKLELKFFVSHSLSPGGSNNVLMENGFTHHDLGGKFEVKMRAAGR